MRYDLDQLETFLTVLELGSVTGAAARLNLSKSVVSKRVADLEGELGAALFRRNAGRIAPTEAAHRLAEGLRPALAEVRAAAEAVSCGSDQALRGSLSISAPVSFGTLHLSGFLADFALAHPGIVLRVDYDDSFVDLARGGYDLGVRIGTLDDSPLMVKKLCEDGSIACAAPAFLDRRGRPDSPQALSGWPVIGYSRLSNGTIWRFRQGTRWVHPDVVEVAAVNNGEAMRDLAIAGLGLAMLPGFIAQPAIAAGRLERILPDVATRAMPINAVWPPVRPIPAKLRALIDGLAAHFASGVPWQRG